MPANVRSSVVLPAPLDANQAEPVTGPQREGNVPQRLHHDAVLIVLAEPAGGGGQHRLFQAAAAAVIQRKQH